MKKITISILVLAVCLFFLSSPFVLAQDFCEGNFDYDSDQDGSDAFTFKEDFGRSTFGNPCPSDGPAPVPVTGQTTCYDENGVQRICAIQPFFTGEDGAWRKGVAWPNPRFTDNGDGTVTDNLTGLIWLKDAECFGSQTWQEALNDCNSLAAGDNLCTSHTFSLTDGSSAGDWRLPNRFELESLLSLEYANPSVPNTTGTGQWSEGDPFINLIPQWYWSSTSHASSPDEAWCVMMQWARVLEQSKSFPFRVWPVRGGH